MTRALPFETPVARAEPRTLLIDKVKTSEYVISLWYELGKGDAGFAALFSDQSTRGDFPRGFPKTSKVELAHGISGFFLPISCGGSCAPANLWWNGGEILYQIQSKLPSTVSEHDQEKAIKALADLAILAGPR
jgi:hypothetical protein